MKSPFRTQRPLLSRCAWITTLICLLPRTVLAGFIGPATIVTSDWGSGDSQVGIEYQDTSDVFPRHFGTGGASQIVISDQVNSRIKIYTGDGALSRIIKPQGMRVEVMQAIVNWPGEDILVSDNYILTLEADYTQLYDYSGNLYKNFTFTSIKGNAVYIFRDGSFITQGGGTNYYRYSSSGQLLQSYNTKPLELGVIGNESRQPDRSYKITVRYPERAYSIITPGQSADEITRDSFGYLYAIQRLVDQLNPGTPEVRDIQHYRAIRFNSCGKETARLDLPNNESELSPEQPIIGRVRTVIAEYGQPVIAPNGDVYTWKRTPDKYSILKWTWVDDPNVPTGPEPPTNLSLTPSINGLYLTWQASPNDPGCVTKYEIARATTSGGVFSTIDTVEKGVLKYNDTTAETGTTYYYKVRAMAGSDPSAYTAAVVGKP